MQQFQPDQIEMTDLLKARTWNKSSEMEATLTALMREAISDTPKSEQWHRDLRETLRTVNRKLRELRAELKANIAAAETKEST